jgi:hypothetical protein
VGKGKRADVYLEVRKRRGGIYIFRMKQVPVGSLHFIFLFFDSA